MTANMQVSKSRISEVLRSGTRVAVTFTKRDGSERVLVGAFDPAGEAENVKASQFVVMAEDGKPEDDKYRHVNVDTVKSVVLLAAYNTLSTGDTLTPVPPKAKPVLPRQAATRAEIVALAKSGGFVTVTFIKKDGSLRELNGRHSVAKHTVGGVRTSDPSQYLILWETGHDDGHEAYRNVAIERIVSLVSGGVEYYPQ